MKMIPSIPAQLECMNELVKQGRKVGPWVEYEPPYEKHYCDVRTEDGRTLTRCWPNAGRFQGREGMAREEDVTHWRLRVPLWYQKRKEMEATDA